jgi:molecular chaperone DnaJ
VILKVPAGTQSGKLFRLKGKGIRTLQGYVGDHFVRVMVETPTNLSRNQRELLEKFAESCGESTHPQAKGFLDAVSRFFKNL